MCTPSGGVPSWCFQRTWTPCRRSSSRAKTRNTFTGVAVASRSPRGSRYLINGEPTESKVALGSKGILRYEIVAAGKMAHSAYPELGESAIEKLLDALEATRRVPLPE